jgi:hypothetical protein
MKNLAVWLAVLATAGIFFLSGAPAQAQASRTWVSGVGDDANPCSRTAPCKTFAGAISKTAPGGEIDCLDPAGYGAVTITKAMTIECLGTFGSVLVSGTNGIVVSAGPNDVVTLRNLSLNGVGSGTNGIRFLAGKALIVDRVDIMGFTTNGLDVSLTGTSANVFVRSLNVTNVGGAGVSVTTTSGFASAQISNSAFAGANTGVVSGANGFVTVANSVFAGLITGASATGNGLLNVDTSLFTNNGTGVNSASGTQVRVSNNSLYDNTNAFAVNGTMSSAGNNHIVGATGNPNGAAYATK